MSQAKQVKHLIIGAGLSGLTAAYELLKVGETDFLVLESRDRVGGRICTSKGIDLGATWFQRHHIHLNELLDEVGIGRFHQYREGTNVLVYSSMASPHLFESDQGSEAASRISGGSSALIERLAVLCNDQIILNAKVEKIRIESSHLVVESNTAAYRTESLVVTMPPKLSALISYEPAIPAEVLHAMKKTHTWMSNAIKVGITFQVPFWRKKGFSGTLLGQVGPVTELYDHTDAGGQHYSLMGFVNEALRDLAAVERKQVILDYLSLHLGNEVRDFLQYQEKDWSTDPFTSDLSLKSIYMSPQYGNPQFSKTYLQGRLIFSGAETSPVHGGYMDGAVYSGLKAAARLLANHKIDGLQTGSVPD